VVSLKENLKKEHIEKAIKLLRELLRNQEVENITPSSFTSLITSPCYIYKITKAISYNVLKDTEYSHLNLALIILNHLSNEKGTKLFDIYKKLSNKIKKLRNKEELIREIVKQLERLSFLKSIRNREKLSSMSDEIYIYTEVYSAIKRTPIELSKDLNVSENILLSSGGTFHCDYKIDIPSIFIKKDEENFIPIKQIKFDDIVKISLLYNELRNNFLPISYSPRFLSFIKLLFLLTATGKISIKSDESFTVSTKELVVKKLFLLDIEKETKELFKWAKIDIFSLLKYILSPYTHPYTKEKVLLLIKYGDRFLRTEYNEFRDRTLSLISRFLEIDNKKVYLPSNILKDYNLYNTILPFELLEGIIRYHFKIPYPEDDTFIKKIVLYEILKDNISLSFYKGRLYILIPEYIKSIEEGCSASFIPPNRIFVEKKDIYAHPEFIYLFSLMGNIKEHEFTIEIDIDKDNISIMNELGINCEAIKNNLKNIETFFSCGESEVSIITNGWGLVKDKKAEIFSSSLRNILQETKKRKVFIIYTQ